jgi:hypothetical protein
MVLYARVEIHVSKPAGDAGVVCLGPMCEPFPTDSVVQHVRRV